MSDVIKFNKGKWHLVRNGKPVASSTKRDVLERRFPNAMVKERKDG